jgi:uncharacterized membrane-anchored protein
MGAVLIAVGVPLFFLVRYFQSPEGEKKRKARDLKGVAIVWMAVGVLIYIGVLTGFIAKS